MYATVKNLSPLPFYLTTKGHDGSFWDANRWSTGGEQYSLLSSHTGIPFFVDVESEWVLEEIKVFHMKRKSGLSVDVSDFEPIDPDQTIYPGKTWLEVFKIKKVGNQYINTNHFFTFFPENGFYYIELCNSTSENVYVSEVFRVLQSSEDVYGLISRDGVVGIQWEYGKDLECGGMTIPQSSLNIVNVEGTVSNPEYVYEEEGEERMGYFYPVKQISNKKYRFSFVAPEYLCDAVRLLPLASKVLILDRRNGFMNPTQFNVDISWLEGGHYAQVDCEFTTDSVAHVIGNDVNF